MRNETYNALDTLLQKINQFEKENKEIEEHYKTQGDVIGQYTCVGKSIAYYKVIEELLKLSVPQKEESLTEVGNILNYELLF